MAKIITYFTFNGNCREAMTFYQSCLGGELFFQTLGDSPMAGQLPGFMKNQILHAVLKKEAMELMGSDMVGEEGLRQGNALSLMIDCNSELEIKLFYQRLSQEGKATHPLQKTFWGAFFGGLTDKFGNQWLLNYSDKINSLKTIPNMEKLKFETTIDAPRERVWEILWDDASYRKWTATFHEGSHAKTDWEEGSKVHFLGPDGSGMVARIAAKRQPEFMSFQHLGTVKNGVEETDSEETRQWAGALENYHLQENDGKTRLRVDIEVTADHQEYFQTTWPKALDVVKQLSEKA